MVFGSPTSVIGTITRITPPSARNGAAARRGARERRHRPAQGTPLARAACRVPVAGSRATSGASRRKPPCGTTIFPSWELGRFEIRSTRGGSSPPSRPWHPTSSALAVADGGLRIALAANLPGHRFESCSEPQDHRSGFEITQPLLAKRLTGCARASRYEEGCERGGSRNKPSSDGHSLGLYPAPRFRRHQPTVTPKIVSRNQIARVEGSGTTLPFGLAVLDRTR